MDPHWFNADPEPAFFLIADPDPNADPDPVPELGFWWPKIYSWKLVLYFFDQKLQFTYP